MTSLHLGFYTKLAQILIFIYYSKKVLMFNIKSIKWKKANLVSLMTVFVYSIEWNSQFVQTVKNIKQWHSTRLATILCLTITRLIRCVATHRWSSCLHYRGTVALLRNIFSLCRHNKPTTAKLFFRYRYTYHQRLW